MRTRILTATAALALLIALGGCAKTPEPTPVDPPDIALPNSYENTDSGYALDYPEGWSIVHSENADKLLDEITMDIEGKKKAELIKTAKEQGFVFLLDDAVADYGANISISVSKSRSGPGRYLGREKRLTEAFEKTFGEIDYIRPFTFADLGRGGDTVMFAFAFTIDDKPQVIRQYVIFNKKQIFTLTMNCPGADADYYGEIGDAIAASFRFTEAGE